MKLNCVGMTDVGCSRDHNEDDFYLSDGEEALCVVADGMGGHKCGEVASAMVIKTIVEFYRETMDSTHGDSIVDTPGGRISLDQFRLFRAIQQANKAVFDVASENENYRGMGTTMVSSFFTENGVYLAHVGDSRAYRFRSGKLEQQTEDHSLANEYVRMGVLSPEDIEHFPYKNVITRACGLTDDVEIEISFREIEAGDLYILCSDGLTDMVNDAELSEVIAGCDDDLEGLCRLLIDRANENGGADNITVILAKVEEV